jgi:hypothetical protein
MKNCRGGILLSIRGRCTTKLCAIVWRNSYTTKLLRRATNASMGEWCSHAPTKLYGAQRNLCGALCTISPTTTKCGHNRRICCKKHAKHLSYPIQRGSIRLRQCKYCLWAWAPSPSTAGSIRWRWCPILLWARVQPPRLSIPTTDRRLEGGALVFFSFPFFFNFQLVFAYVCVVFSVFI